MKSLLLCLLPLLPVEAFHLRIQGRRNVPESDLPALRRRGPLTGTSSLDNSADISYYANLTLNGEEFEVLVDTGSSDLWVAGTVPNARDTGKSSGVNYAVGAVEGPIKTADLEFAGYSIEDQAYLEVTPDDTNPEGKGLIGLGPLSGSNIYDELDESNSAVTVLDRIFLQNTSTPNYLTVLLGRTQDPTDEFEGDLTIGSIIEDFADISNQPKLAVSIVPVRESSDQHFQLLVDEDGILGPDGNPINVSTEVDETSNKEQLTAVVDTGFSLSQVPKYIADNIYSRFEGAEFLNISGIGPVWVVPCELEVNMTWKFSGQSYPIHPLDTTINPEIFGTTGVVNSNGDDCCIGSFQPMSFNTGDSPNYDIILGMSFLRNAYTLFDFGDFVADATDEKDDPYLQFLSITEPAEAHSDFVQVRLNGDDITGDQVLLEPTSSGPPKSSDENKKSDNNSRRTLFLALSIVAIAIAVFLIILSFILWRRRRSRQAVYKPLGTPPANNTYPMSSAPYSGGYESSHHSQPLYDPYSSQNYNSPWDHRT